MKHLGSQVIETSRLRARPFTQADISAVYQHWTSDPKVTPHLTWSPHTSIHDTTAYIEGRLEAYKDKRTYAWGIELKSLGAVIGDISVIRIDEKTATAELGWVLGRQWWQQGYMTEIAEAVVTFLLEEVGFNRVMASHASENIPSGRVMQKIGMTYEGRLRQAGKTNQGIVDVLVYARLQQDNRNISKK